MDFVVRTARASDADALSTLIRGLGLFARLDSESPDVTAGRIDRHLKMCLADDSHTVLLAAAPDGEVIAYAAVHWLPYLILTGPEGYVSELFVAPSFRGRGPGTRLLKAITAEARERQCARLMLGAVKSRESYQRGFYTQRGWLEREDMANMVYDLARERQTGS